MELNNITRTVTLGRKDCWSCSHNEPKGTVATPVVVPCGKCRGTGRRGSGNCRACNGHGTKTAYDHEKRMDCTVCGGNYAGYEPEIWTDNVPSVWFNDMEIKHQIVNRQATWNEQHIGAGSLWSVIDYGAAWHQAHDGNTSLVVNKVLTELTTGRDKVQLCKIVKSKDDLTLCDNIVINVTRDGYTVNAGWEV